MFNFNRTELHDESSYLLPSASIRLVILVRIVTLRITSDALKLCKIFCLSELNQCWCLINFFHKYLPLRFEFFEYLIEIAGIYLN